MDNGVQNVLTNSKVEKELAECLLCLTMKANDMPITVAIMKTDRKQIFRQTVAGSPQHWTETYDLTLYNLAYTALKDRQAARGC